MNKKGFTLVELLGVIVILGIVLSIAIPATTGYIDKSKREAFSTVLHEYVDAVRKSIVSEEYSAPSDKGKVTIISLDLIPLDKGKQESSYQSEWIKSKSYIVVVNSGGDGEYDYYAAAQDKEDHAIALTKIEDITRNKVISNAKNKMEVTIQSLCGNEKGKETTLSTIKGLEEIQPIDKNGNKVDWNATIYSSKDCAS